ncbi:MAG: MaoC/PaaZ C-terminal domain-containing protein [Acidimicrobiia bacterium]
MSIEDLAGVSYGPYAYRTDPEKVGEYATIVGAADTPGRAPQSLAGALLFVVAPHLLSDERAGEDTRSVIHGDQGFTWHAPIPLGADLAVTGTVTRVRERGGVFFTTFELVVETGGATVLTGSSTFLMSGGETAPGAGGAERPEPAPDVGSRCEVTGGLGDEPAELGCFSASRSDLVRYAGASRDWNPIHWDHAAAVAAGLPGVVVHGLLQSAWVIEASVRLGIEPASARFRYRRPLGAAVEVRLTGSRRDTGASFELGDEDGAFLAVVVE